jgi:hypothetical protein
VQQRQQGHTGTCSSIASAGANPARGEVLACATCH